MTDALLDAVDRLTLPQENHLAQIGDDGKWIRAHTVTLPPLLQQLGDAVNPSSNTTAGSASSPATRAPLDVTALYEWSKMSSAIRSWCHMRGVEVTRNPVNVVEDLTNWYHSTVGTGLLGTFYIRELDRWADLIENLLTPGQQFEADYPCPICKATSWGNAVDGGSTRAILITYRKDDHGFMSDERAMCRPCRTVWLGHDSLMELAEEQHEAS